MKYYHALSPVLISVSMVLVQSQVAVGLSASEVEKIAREITVQIIDSQNPSFAGSGIIIKQTGNTYTVLTARHVAKEGKKQIITPDKQTYQIKNIKLLPSLDLAVVEFNSNQKYTTAKIGDSDKVTNSSLVYVAGFPAKTSATPNVDFRMKDGKVDAKGSQRDGYDLSYDNRTSRSELGDKLLAIADYNTAIKINPNLALAYCNLGNVRNELGDKLLAIADLQKASELFRQQGNTALYQQALELIRKYQQ